MASQLFMHVESPVEQAEMQLDRLRQDACLSQADSWGQQDWSIQMVHAEAAADGLQRVPVDPP
jgi:hypothetical protein